MTFKGKKHIRIICMILLIVFIPMALFGSFVEMLFWGISGDNGCSYTEDIANYGKYDKPRLNQPYFPESITEDMTVVRFSYYYARIDVDHEDIYLEVKFKDKTTMEEYLTAAKNAFSKNGFVSYPNPYDAGYTDLVEKEAAWRTNKVTYASRIVFGGDDNDKYVDMLYQSVSYSYDELTIIYNYTNVGSDIEVGAEPDREKYYPKYLERFGVEWDPKNNFGYKLVEE